MTRPIEFHTLCIHATRRLAAITARTPLVHCFFAVMLLVTGLMTSGCDTLDSNAVEDAPPHDETRLLTQPSESFHYTANTQASNKVDQFTEMPYEEPYWLELVGSWEYLQARTDSDEKRRSPVITFNENLVIVETICGIYRGSFSSESRGQLTIFNLELKTAICDRFPEDPMIASLGQATEFEIAKDQLMIRMGDGRREVPREYLFSRIKVPPTPPFPTDS